MSKNYRRHETALELLYNLKFRRYTVPEIKIFEYMHIVVQIMGGKERMKAS